MKTGVKFAIGTLIGAILFSGYHKVTTPSPAPVRYIGPLICAGPA